MKSRLMVASAAGLLVMAGFAHSQSMPDPQQPTPQENAVTQAAPSDSAATQAYGGMPDTKMQSGWKNKKSCSNDPQCNIFFGGS